MNSPQNNHENGRQPDPDAIKMFVGQVPRTMDENDLRKMFEEYGPVFQLNVLRDKVNNQSKGCCFVTFYTRKSALDAQNALHNIKTMPGMHHPVQMKPADSEKRNEERKLFIGMLSKKFNENEVKMMFAPFGNIEDCTVLRDQNNQSRGCAFVTYANRQSAQNCIKNMHHSQTMEGCSSPLVVKFADTQKEKEQKKLQQMNANLWSSIYGGGGGGGGITTNNIAPQYLALLQQAAAQGNLGLFSNVGSLGNLGLLAALASLTSGSSGGNNSTSPSGNSSGNGSSAAGDASNMHLQNLQGLAALANAANSPGILNALSTALGLPGLQNLGQNLGQNMGQNVGGNMANNMGGMNQMGTGGAASNSHSQSASLSGSLSTSTSSLSGLTGLQGIGTNNLAATSMSPGLSNSMNGLSNGNPSGMDTLTQAYTGIQQYAASFPNAFQSQTAQQLQAAANANSPAGKQTEGPEGANLFIYHLPQEFSDQDLMQTFMPFGNVISAKVFIDKQTNLSKCFGFVSYDNAVSAQAAIQAMNGFQIGMKRLKVQLKRPKSESKPY